MNASFSLRIVHMFWIALMTLCVSMMSTQLTSAAAPTGVPYVGAFTGGAFSQYFRNIIENPCPSGSTIAGYNMTPGMNYGLPNCMSSEGYWKSNDGGSNIYFTGAGNVAIGQSTASPVGAGGVLARLTLVGGDASINSLTIGKGRGNILSNTALGYATLYANTTGTNNTAVGASALMNNTTGIYNTAVGTESLGNNTLGSNNIAIGRQALYNNTGNANIGIGEGSLRYNTGNNNTAIGVGSLSSNNVAGDDNTVVGASAMGLGTTGNANSVLGVGALFFNTTGSENTTIGRGGLMSNTTGSRNIAIGVSAGGTNTTGNNNISIGYIVNTLSPTGSNQLNIGNWIYGNNGNIGIGGGANTEKFRVVGNAKVDTTLVVGGGATIETLTIGLGSGSRVDNTAIGYTALSTNTNGSNNTAIGYRTLARTTTGGNNTANGANALYNNTTGYHNTAQGVDALLSNITGQYNTGLGSSALRGNQGGHMNTSVGYQSLNANITGNSNTAIGYQAGTTVTGSGNILIGWGAQAPSPAGSNQLNIGNWIYGNNGNIGIGTNAPSEKLHVSGNVQVTGTVTSGGGFIYSDRNLKKDILPLENALDRVRQLGGYSFVWKATDRKDIGVIAQEVEAVFPDAVHTDPTTGLKSVEYANLVAPLIEAIKDQQKMIDSQNARIQALESRLNAIQ